MAIVQKFIANLLYSHYAVPALWGMFAAGMLAELVHELAGSWSPGWVAVLAVVILLGRHAARRRLEE